MTQHKDVAEPGYEIKLNRENIAELFAHPKIIVGAWKAYLGLADARNLAGNIADWRTASTREKSFELVLAPSLPLIPIVLEAVRNTDIRISSQDVDSISEYGAHTGRIPPRLLSEMGCQYTLLGHSEMRAIESQESIQEKTFTALTSSELQLILCVGETAQEKSAGRTIQTLREQLESALDGITANHATDRLHIAYEPVWAISTENPVEPPRPDDITPIHEEIRNILTDRFGAQTAQTVRILYGGSVNQSNILDYLDSDMIDGVLVGSASAKPGFLDMLDIVERHMQK